MGVGSRSYTYRIVALDPDYRRSISVNPSFRDLHIYTRAVPIQGDRNRLVERARQLGYPVDRFELPEKPLA